MYDERADVTDTTEIVITKTQQDGLVSQANAANANSTPSMSNQLNTQILNNGGTQLGFISNSNTSGSTETGNIAYTQFFDETVNNTQNYFSLVESFIKKILETTNLGVYKQLSTEKQFSTGSLNTFDTPVTNVNILGKFVSYDKYILDLTNELTNNVNTNTDFLTTALSLNNVSQSDIMAVKTNFINQISIQSSDVIGKISSQIQGISNSQATNNQSYRKLDLICSATDGKITPLGVPYVYTLTGLPDGASDTLSTIRVDYIKLASDIQSYYNLLVSNDIILTNTTVNTTFTPISNQNITGSVNRFFTLFCNQVIDDNQRQSLIEKLCVNLMSSTVDLTKTVVAKTINDLSIPFQVEKNAELDKFNLFFDSPDYTIYKNYNPLSLRGKTRDFTYTNAGTTSTQINNVKNLYSNVNVNLDKTTYNGKIIFS